MSDGLCCCGCGLSAGIATRNDARIGHVKGQPKPFIKGHSRWRGTPKVTPAGYVMVFAPDHPSVAGLPRYRQYVAEHVLVVERRLGHRLPPEAVVHHVNGIKGDNRPSNLLPLQNQSEHQDLHNRLRVLRAGGNPFTQRICCDCKRVLSLEAFYPSAVRTVSGECRECSRKSARERQRRQRSEPPYAA